MQDFVTMVEAAAVQLRAHIQNYGLPPGAAVDVESVSARYGVSPEVAIAVLQRLELEGHLESDDSRSYHVATADSQRLKHLMARIEPVLVAMAQIAATQAQPADVAAMTVARNRMDAAISIRDGAARAQAYRDFITAWAAATGNAFYISAASMLLRESGDLIDILTRIDLVIYTENSEDGELRRLVDAVSAGNPILAAQAAGDHALIMANRLEGLAASPVNASVSVAASPDPALPGSRETSSHPSGSSSSGSIENGSSAAPGLD